METTALENELDLVARELTGTPRLGLAWQVIEERHTDSTLRLDEGAAAAGIEKNYLNRLLTEAVGTTFHQLLIRRRLLTAVELLSRESLSLTEVTAASGFGSLSSFERNCGRLLGGPPREVRRRCRAEHDRRRGPAAKRKRRRRAKGAPAAAGANGANGANADAETDAAADLAGDGRVRVPKGVGVIVGMTEATRVAQGAGETP